MNAIAERWIGGRRRELLDRALAIDQHGQVIDVLLSARRDLGAARRFFILALCAATIPAEVTTDRAPAYPRVLDELIPSALHTVERYANNPVEADHGRLKARLRPIRGLKRHRSAPITSAGHAFVRNIRRSHYELATDIPARHRDPPSIRRARDGHLISRPPFSSHPVMRTDQPTQHCPCGTPSP
jgi:transposase-like protein